MRLQEWCDNNKLDYKILLTDSVKNVNRLKRIVNKDGCLITNLEGNTLTALARKIVIEDYAQSGKLIKTELAERDMCVLIINQLIKNDTSGKYSFIPKESICFQTAEEILHIINIIRMGDRTSEYETTSVKKEDQLKELVKDYEKKLEDENLFDEVSIIEAATESLVEKRVQVDAKIGVLSYMLPKLTYIEKQFLEALDKFYVEIECYRDSKVDANFYEVYGQSNEIQVVISEIEKNNIPFGLVNVLYSSSEYENIIRMALSERDIPYVFATGSSIREKSYISLLLAILNWARNDYSYDYFRSVVDNVLVRLGRDYSFGKKAGIGWGLERYELFAKKMRSEKESYLKVLLKHKRIREISNPDDGKKHIEECSDDFVNFVDSISKLFRKIEQSPIEVGDAYRSIIKFIKDNTYEFEKDKMYLSTLERKEELFAHVGKVDTYIEALDIIFNEIESLKIAEDEMPNAVSVMQVGKTAVLERPFQFCIGMSYDAFGAQTVDSPVLSDERLLNLVCETSGFVKLRRNSVLEKKESFINSLSSMPNGQLVITACEYDTKNFRKTALSEAYIELKNKYGCKKTLQAEYPVVVDSDINYTLDKKELFKEADESLIFVPKNGYIEEDTKNGFRVVKLGRVSPTALHNMMECAWKFDYYIKYFESHNIEKNVMVWLPSNEKGNLFHQVFQEYCDAMLKGKKLNTSDTLDLSVLKVIFDNAVSEFEILVAKGSSQAYDMEKALIWEQIKEYMEVLYADLKNSSEGWVVKECEREFETENMYIDETGEYVSSDESCDVIEFSCHGFLDRIDSYIDDADVEHARIIDYKTGKKDNLERKIKNNTQIQHAIYSMAVSEEVDYFSYDFPCDNNLRIEKKDKDISELPKVFRERMADILLNNNYNLYIDSACEYCDYKNICVHRMNLD